MSTYRHDDHLPATKGDIRVHAEADLEFQTEIYGYLKTALAEVPKRADLDKLATKKDIEGVVTAYKRFTKAAEIVEKSGKFTWKTVSAVASIILAISLLTGAWRIALTWLGTLAFHVMPR